MACSGDNCDHQATRSTVVSELTQVDPLPGPQVQSSICDGNSHRTAYERSLQVSGHIICSFINMRIERVIFRHQVVNKCLKIRSYRSVCILIQSQSGRCMLDLNMHDSGIGQLACCFFHPPGDQVKPPGMGRQHKRKLIGHGCSKC